MKNFDKFLKFLLRHFQNTHPHLKFCSIMTSVYRFTWVPGELLSNFCYICITMALCFTFFYFSFTEICHSKKLPSRRFYVLRITYHSWPENSKNSYQTRFIFSSDSCGLKFKPTKEGKSLNIALFLFQLC